MFPCFKWYVAFWYWCLMTKTMLILAKQWPFPSLSHLLHQSRCQLQRIIFPFWSFSFPFLLLVETLVQSVKVSMPTGSRIPSLLSNLAICSDSSFVSVAILLHCLCDWQVTLNLLSAFIRADCKLKLYRRNPLPVVIWILSVLIVPSFKSLMIFFWCCQTIMFGFCFERNCRVLLYKSLLMLNSCNVVFPQKSVLFNHLTNYHLLHSIVEQLTTDDMYLNNEVTYLFLRTCEMCCSRISNIVCAKFE